MKDTKGANCYDMKCAPLPAGDTPSTDFPPGDTTWKFALAPPSYLIATIEVWPRDILPYSTTLSSLEAPRFAMMPAGVLDCSSIGPVLSTDTSICIGSTSPSPSLKGTA